MKPDLKFLSDQDIDQIHQAALDILARIGMRLPAPEALDILQKAGAEIKDGDKALIPPGVVAQALSRVPKRNEVVLYGRLQEHDLDFSSHRPALSCMTMATHVIDPFNGERRSATTEDLARLTRIADRLDNIRVNGGLITPQEVPGDFNDWYTWATCLKNTDKHITGGMYGTRCVQDAMSMASLTVDGRDAFLKRPHISGWVLTMPPLAIDRESLEALLEMARWNIPSIISSGPIIGTTSPITIPGTCAQAQAEILACITLTQLVNPGAPVVYTSFARGMDMKTGNVHMASPEFAILKGCMSQLGRWLDMPVRMPGLLRDSKTLDAQAGFETGLVGAITAMNADIIDAMQLDSDLLVDFADPVFCNECMGGLERLTREVTVDQASLALEVIAEVGSEGTFLTHDHTYAHFQDELWIPKLMEHRSYESWEQDGALDIRSKSLNLTRQMIKDHDESNFPLPVQEAIDDVVTRAVNRQA
ncbi:MAG: trimethylamine methyltransferase family protein [Desulfohalobiaceae bacterium]|nr:trimethylamine methyltransferase family protein [Desulfohalobiaceae bacterium]